MERVYFPKNTSGHENFSMQSRYSSGPSGNIKTNHLWMKPVLSKLSIVVVVLLFAACKGNDQNSGLKNVTGRPGELFVVATDEIWDGTVDSVFRQYLGQPQAALPQAEPIFDVMQVPPSAFTGVFKSSRSLLLVYVGSDIDSSSVMFSRDKYAFPQALVSISARDKAELLKLFTSSSDKIIGFFMKAERERLQLNYAKLHEKEILVKANELFDVSINVAPGFKIAKTDSNFLWARYETPEISQGIIIYSYPYTSDSAFTASYITEHRNTILKKHIPGPTPGSYMSTETQFPLLLNSIKKDGNYAVEVRGLWQVENDFMGGPFVSLSILDVLKRRVVTVEGFVYAPANKKRNLLQQVEAMAYSLKFDKQKDMDKLNVQVQ